MPVRTVTLCRHVPKTRRGGGRTLLWAFSAADLSALLGVSCWKLRRMVIAGEVDPTDLESIALAWLARRPVA